MNKHRTIVKKSVRTAILLVFVVVFGAAAARSQDVVRTAPTPAKSDLQKLVETELAFAATAAEKGTKTAFLTFLADDGIVFDPTEANGKLVWRGKPDSPALLAWQPAWADLSSDGRLGYTTGGWEYRPKGGADRPTAFGEYVTIWQKQTDGSFKAVLDIGISHPTSSYSKEPWKSAADAGTGARGVKTGVDSGTLTDIFSNKSMANGYFNYLAEDCRVLREGHLPFTGKQTAYLAMERLDREFPPSSFLNFTGSMSRIFGNLMYVWGEYKLTAPDGTERKWNFVQIWKNRAAKWQIVLDVFRPVPEKQK